MEAKFKREGNSLKKDLILKGAELASMGDHGEGICPFCNGETTRCSQGDWPIYQCDTCQVEFEIIIRKMIEVVNR